MNKSGWVLGLLLSAAMANCQVPVQYTYVLERRAMPRDINVSSEVNDMIADKVAQGYGRAEVEKNRAILTKAFSNIRNGTTHTGTVSLIYSAGRSLVVDSVGVAHDPKQVIETCELFDGTNTWRDATLEPSVLVVAGDQREHLCAFGDRWLLAHESDPDRVALPKEFSRTPGAVAHRYAKGGVEVLVPTGPKGDLLVFQKFGNAYKKVGEYVVTGVDGMTSGKERRVVTVTRFSSAGKPTVIERFSLLRQEQMEVPAAPPTIMRGRPILDARLGETKSDTYFWEGHLKPLNMVGAEDRPQSDEAGVLNRAGVIVLVGVTLIAIGFRMMRRRANL